MTVGKHTTTTATSVTQASVALGATGKISDTATVTGTATNGAPAGTLTFFVCGPDATTAAEFCATGVAGHAPVATKSTATGTPSADETRFVSVTVSVTTAGVYCFAALYSGTAKYLGSSDNTGATGKTTPVGPFASECVSVGKHTTTTATSVTQASVALGATGKISDTATVTGTATNGAPAGTLTFFVCGPDATTAAEFCATGVAGHAPVATKSTATGTPSADETRFVSVTFPVTTAGVYCFAALYSGTAKYLGSSDNTGATGKTTPVGPFASECVSVGKHTTTTATSVTQASVALGATGKISDTATVTGTATNGAPAGTLTFFVCGPDATTAAEFCATGVAGHAPVATKSTATGTPSADETRFVSVTVSVTTAGVYCFAALYSGTAKYLGSSDNTGATGKTTPVGPFASECVSVGKHTTTTATSVTQASVALGATGKISDTATVTGTATNGAPAGTLTFFVCGPDATTAAEFCATGVAGHAPVATKSTATGTPSADETRFVSVTVSVTTAGVYCFAALYSGTARYLGSSDNTGATGKTTPVGPFASECVTVGKHTTTTATSVTQASVALGATGKISDTATVTGTATNGAPAGTLTFFVCGPDATTAAEFCATGVAGHAPVATKSTATGTPSADETRFVSVTVSVTTAGVYCFAALYSGTAKYLGSSDNTGATGKTTPVGPFASECVSVGKHTTTTATSVTQASVALGATGKISDTATVTGTATNGAPAGTLTFFVCGPDATTAAEFCATGVAGHAPVATKSTATGTPSADETRFVSVTFPVTTAGVYCFAALYSGTARYLGSSDNTGATGKTTPVGPFASECVSVGKHTTTTATSVTQASVALGATGKISDTATVTGTATNGAPAGTLTFFVCGPDATTAAEFCATGVAGHAPVATKSTATGTPSADETRFVSVTVSVTTAGVYCFAALYSGTARYLGSSDNTGATGKTTPVGPFASECVTVGKHTTRPPPTTPPPSPPAKTPKFTVTKSDTPGTGKSVVPGATIAYTVLVKNVGTAAGSAKITDPLPANVTLSGTPACTTVAATDKCAVTVTGTTLVMKVTLANGDSVKVAFSATVKSTDSTTVVNTATITTGPCTKPNCTSTVTNPVVVLSVVKSSTPKPGSVVPPSTTVTYTLTLTDSGTAATTPVQVNDTVPVGTTYVTGSATCGGAPGCSVSEATGTVTWTGIVVAPGASNSVAVSFQVTVGATDTNGQKITNVAVFTNEGTPGCGTALTCTTNHVTLVVVVKSSAVTHTTPPATPPTTTPPPAPKPPKKVSKAATTPPTPRTPTKVSQATTSHTGEPWAGSLWAELVLSGTGFYLICLGTWLLRRRRAKVTSR